MSTFRFAECKKGFFFSEMCELYLPRNKLASKDMIMVTIAPPEPVQVYDMSYIADTPDL